MKQGKVYSLHGGRTMAQYILYVCLYILILQPLFFYTVLVPGNGTALLKLSSLYTPNSFFASVKSRSKRSVFIPLHLHQNTKHPQTKPVHNPQTLPSASRGS